MFVLDKAIVEANKSAIILAPNLILCCGKDGQIRLFRNNFEVKIYIKKNHLFIFSS
jgi:hypothetical protein